MRKQVLIYEYVADMVTRRQPHRAGHLALIASWRADGRLAAAGALGDPPTGGLLVFDVDDRGAVEQFVALDPYVAASLVTAWRIEPWNLVA